VPHATDVHLLGGERQVNASHYRELLRVAPRVAALVGSRAAATSSTRAR
jgi:hypothetical protein